MRVRVLWFGRPGGSPYERQVAEYRTQVARRWPAEDIPLRPAAGGRKNDPRRALREEGRTVLGRLPLHWRLVALDEGGKALSSEELARTLGAVEESGCPGIVFVVGSDLGLSPEILDTAWLQLSLSRLTLPHLLARLLLWEQLFRSADIRSGGAYHRRSVQWNSADGGPAS
jgi:23S rRNA (pseudouridine1915-N3)-methyltransferase